MRVQHLSLRQQLPAPVVAAVSGGSVSAAKAGTYYIFAQGRNRAGVNTLSLPTQVTVATGQSIQLTVPTDYLRTGEGTRRIIFSISPDTTPINAKVVASFELYQADEKTPADLPATLLLSRDEHLTTDASVANVASLPSGADRVNGMRRRVLATGNINEWNARAAQWLEIYPNSFSAYVTDTTDPLQFGSDRDVSIIPARETLYPAYTPNGSEGVPVAYALFNNGTSPITKGTRVGLSVQADEVDVTSQYSGRLILSIAGFSDYTTGDLDVTGMATNLPYRYQPGKTNLALEKNLPINQSLVLKVSPIFTSSEFSYGVYQGMFLKILPYFYPTVGAYDPTGIITGDFIAAEGSRRRIVPGVGLSAIALDGTGMVDSYVFPMVDTQSVSGLVANTANQRILITGEGTCFLSPDGNIPGTTALRAIVGTVNGEGAVSPWSAPISVSAAQQIRVTVTFPTVIRGSYPDAVAGMLATFNASKIAVYVRKTSDGAITRTLVNRIGAGASQVIDISSPGTAVGTSLPASPAASFGLFELGSSSFTAQMLAVAGGFAGTSNYEVAIAPYWEDAVTQISHAQSSGCIPEFTEPLSSLLSSVSTTTASFVQPAINELVDISVTSAGRFAIGQDIYIEGAGSYKVNAKPGASSLQLRLLEPVVTIGATVAFPQIVTASGKVGAQGSSPGLKYTAYSYNSVIGVDDLFIQFNGGFGYNSQTFTSITQLVFNILDRNSGTSAEISLLKNNDIIHVQQENGGLYRRFRATAAPVLNGGIYYSVTAVPLSSTFAPADGTPVSITFERIGVTGPQGLVGESPVLFIESFDTRTIPTTPGQMVFNYDTQDGIFGLIVGHRMRAVASTGGGVNFVEGRVSVHNTTTGQVTVQVDLYGGTGSFDQWTLAVAGSQGQQGASPALTLSSASSITIANNASLTFTFTANTVNGFFVGQRVRAVSGAAFVEGNITALNTSTGSLTILSDKIEGSGTLASWTIGVAGLSGVAGTTGGIGPIGPQGIPGPASYSLTTASFVQPASQGSVNISVQNTDWIVAGQNVFIESAGTYEVLSIVSATQISAKNLNYTGAAAPGSTVATNKKITSTGVKGADGSATLGIQSVIFTTSSIAAGATENLQANFAKVYEILSLTTTFPARVRIYMSAAARTADASRAEGTEIVTSGFNEHGMVAEFVTAAGNLDVITAPIIAGQNGDTPRTAVAYIAVTNKDTVARAIQSTVEIVGKVV